MKSQSQALSPPRRAGRNGGTSGTTGAIVIAEIAGTGSAVIGVTAADAAATTGADAADAADAAEDDDPVDAGRATFVARPVSFHTLLQFVWVRGFQAICVLPF
jgi:hypothetical protein